MYLQNRYFKGSKFNTQTLPLVGRLWPIALAKLMRISYRRIYPKEWTKEVKRKKWHGEKYSTKFVYWWSLTLGENTLGNFLNTFTLSDRLWNQLKRAIFFFSICRCVCVFFSLSIFLCLWICKAHTILLWASHHVHGIEDI